MTITGGGSGYGAARARPGAAPPFDPSSRFGVALLVSLALHGFVAFGVGFKLPDPRAVFNSSPPIDVVLVNARTREAPEKADALAQANLAGGGNTDEDRRAKSPLPPKDDVSTVEMKQAARKVKELEAKARKLMTKMQEQAPAKPPPAVPEKPRPEAQPEPQPDAGELMARAMQMAKLQAQIEKDWESYQKRPRRTFVGARTREYRFARYVEDWRAKVEKIGNLNYPDQARRDRIYGSLVVSVSIKADGSVDKVEINRSSGHKVLDTAALRIVELAAPYAPFSADIQRDTDILVITRTWTFTRSDQLVAQ
ncbi:MAG: TonB family protein [Pseudomonadota bacterium]